MPEKFVKKSYHLPERIVGRIKALSDYCYLTQGQVISLAVTWVEQENREDLRTIGLGKLAFKKYRKIEKKFPHLLEEEGD